MKITLTDGLIIDNDDLNNLNYVDVTIGKESVSVPIDELLSAVEAFYKYRSDDIALM
jgi:hypothetical protein